MYITSILHNIRSMHASMHAWPHTQYGHLKSHKPTHMTAHIQHSQCNKILDVLWELLQLVGGKDEFGEVHLVPPLFTGVAATNVHCLVRRSINIDSPHTFRDCSKWPDTRGTLDMCVTCVCLCVFDLYMVCMRVCVCACVHLWYCRGSLLCSDNWRIDLD